jgi:guanylate kinase
MTQHAKILLCIGPSGVGKSALMQSLLERDDRFTQPIVYTTRAARAVDEKISIRDEEMDEMEAQRDIVMFHYENIRYATSVSALEDLLYKHLFPILDWVAEEVDVIRSIFLDRMFVVYVTPPSLNVLRNRLRRDDRDPHGQRFRAGREELQQYQNGEYDSLCDLHVVSLEGRVKEIGKSIYHAYLREIQPPPCKP